MAIRLEKITQLQDVVECWMYQRKKSKGWALLHSITQNSCIKIRFCLIITRLGLFFTSVIQKLKKSKIDKKYLLTLLITVSLSFLPFMKHVKAVKRVGQRIIKESGLTDLHWEFLVLS